MNPVEEYEQEKKEREEREKNRWEYEKLIHRTLYTSSQEDFDHFFEELIFLKMKINKKLIEHEAIISVHNDLGTLAYDEEVNQKQNFACAYLGLIA